MSLPRERPGLDLILEEKEGNVKEEEDTKFLPTIHCYHVSYLFVLAQMTKL